MGSESAFVILYQYDFQSRISFLLDLVIYVGLYTRYFAHSTILTVLYSFVLNKLLFVSSKMLHSLLIIHFQTNCVGNLLKTRHLPYQLALGSMQNSLKTLVRVDSSDVRILKILWRINKYKPIENSAVTTGLLIYGTVAISWLRWHSVLAMCKTASATCTDLRTFIFFMCIVCPCYKVCLSCGCCVVVLGIVTECWQQGLQPSKQSEEHMRTAHIRIRIFLSVYGASRDIRSQGNLQTNFIIGKNCS